ncbi:MFS transporter [Desertibacillus haloalkaliphilus]|uniref:MFS transporter n=1 Tax=Desertibacillus haloalkaliphilus TaxID=1328930 RepID=UPI001C27D6FF|nr:MFS transporter [Desertibacillus haloalkaliphilus]MBU8908724.1 MFS transporter [Desertibacillus haloalkaliphilus]
MNKTKQNLILMGILTGTFLVPVNSTMIAVGLPTISQDLNVSVTNVTWVVTIYLIVMAAAQPIAGKLGDIYGNKKVMLFGFSLFFVSSIACAFSFNLLSLIVFRSLQALGGALATPNATAVMRHVMPKDKLSNIFGFFGLAMGLGAAIGPMLGSGLITLFSWEAIFWVNVPFLLISMTLTWFIVPSVEGIRNHSLDILGSIYLGTVLTLFTLIVTHREYLNVLTLLSLLVAIALFIYQEKRAKVPLIEFQMFKNLQFSGSNISILINNFVMYSTILFVPLLFETFHFNINMIGALLFAFSLAMSLSSLLGGRLANKYGKGNVISLSFGLLSLTTLSYFWFTNEVSVIYTLIVLIFGGFSVGIGVASMQAANIESVSKEKSGTASGIYSTFRYMGGMIASAVVSVLVGTSMLYILLLIFSLVGLLISIILVQKSGVEQKSTLTG